MNLPIGTIAAIFALILIQGGTAKADTPPFLQNATGEVLSQEEALIAATLNDLANAESQFSKTKDATSILRFYTEDYFGMKDGKLETGRGPKNISQRYWRDLPGQIWSRVNVRLDRNQGGQRHAQETVYARRDYSTSANG